MIKHGEGDKPFWVTEIGWWGTGSRSTGRVAHTGREILADPIVLREDALRAEWMKEMFPRVLAIPGCQKAFLWVAMDEFGGGYAPDKLFGRSTPGQPASPVSLWGIFAGDRSWRKSAYVMQEMLSQ
jgi:hypothetical protein